jgi:hypothetical protein
MANPWTPTGDKWPQPAMVLVREHGVSYSCVKNTDNNSSYSIPSHYLCPMPPTITPKQQAVLDAAVKQAKAFSARNPDAYNAACWTTIDAAHAMLAAQQPPDPMKELLEAAKEIAETTPAASTLMSDDIRRWKRLHAAIAALKAKS